MIGMPHPKWTERPLLVVVLQPGKQPSKEEILGYFQVCLRCLSCQCTICFACYTGIGPLPRHCRRPAEEMWPARASPSGAPFLAASLQHKALHLLCRSTWYVISSYLASNGPYPGPWRSQRRCKQKPDACCRVRLQSGGCQMTAWSSKRFLTQPLERCPS